MSRLTDLQDSLTRGFLGFWIRQYRISYLVVLVLIVMGIASLMQIRKESSPSIPFGVVQIMVAYPGTNPIDMDSLITDKIYGEIKDIDGIDAIAGSSSLGVSMTTVTLKTSANTKDVINDIRNSIGRLVFPTDAKAPVVTELKTDTNQAFSVYIYTRDPVMSDDALRAKAFLVKEAVEKVSGIDSAEFDGGLGYDLQIILDREQLSALGLTIDGVATTIRSWNRDMPIGSYEMSEKKYDFRIEGKYSDAIRLLSIPLSPTQTLGDIARIQRKYKDETRREIVVNLEKSMTGGQDNHVREEKGVETLDSGSPLLLGEGQGVRGGSGQGVKNGVEKSTENLATIGRYIPLTISKIESSSIFAASDAAKAEIEKLFLREDFSRLGYTYGMDLADTIRDDYTDLTHEALTTLILVFLAMFVFVGFRDSLFASLTLPLAFLTTFIGLYYLGYTLNFLTNFSLILSFGIAVDTIIVIVQAASAKIRVGYEPRSAIMLALREYAIPVISGVSTTIVVFIPMMVLPGVMGKFLAYIPITIFFVLFFGLILVLTVNSALYLLFVKRKLTYIEDPTITEYATDADRELLDLERSGKTLVSEHRAALRIRLIHGVIAIYRGVLTWYLENTFIRRFFIFLPILILILSFVWLAPRVGFNLFPSDDQSMISFSVESANGQTTEKTQELTQSVRTAFVGFPEIRYYTISTRGNKTTIMVQLLKKGDREKQGLRSIFELEPLFLDRLTPLVSAGLRVEAIVAKNGPPGSKAVGLKLIANKTEQLPTLIAVSKDFEAHLSTLTGAKNAGTSSADTPGQLVFRLDREKISSLGINPALIYGQIALSMNGQTVGSIEDMGEDMNIVLKMSQFVDVVDTADILALPIIVGPTKYLLGDFVDYSMKNAIASVNRADGKIQITVDADLEKGIDSVSTQSAFAQFAESYTFPAGISYEAGGENESNKELIAAVLSAFFLSILIIFAILTLQFNSFAQPAIVLYSVIMSLPMVMLGLLLTGNQFSLPFGIGFIAFTGIAVNHGIILIDAINQNLKKGMEGTKALIEAGSSRLEPMVLTTLTTVLGILPIALKDLFWAPMGFTIIFGIISTTFLTLFIVKGIYYELFLRKKGE